MVNNNNLNSDSGWCVCIGVLTFLAADYTVAERYLSRFLDTSNVEADEDEPHQEKRHMSISRKRPYTGLEPQKG